jgi:hypothetical protein
MMYSSGASASEVIEFVGLANMEQIIEVPSGNKPRVRAQAIPGTAHEYHTSGWIKKPRNCS